MALKDLQNDLEALGKFIFEGKGEGNKAYRRLWARPSHLFTIDENLTYTELMGHAEGGGSGYENKIRIFQNHLCKYAHLHLNRLDQKTHPLH